MCSLREDRRVESLLEGTCDKQSVRIHGVTRARESVAPLPVPREVQVNAVRDVVDCDLRMVQFVDVHQRCAECVLHGLVLFTTILEQCRVVQRGHSVWVGWGWTIIANV